MASDAPPPSSADLAAIDADPVRCAARGRRGRWSEIDAASPTLTPSAGWWKSSRKVFLRGWDRTCIPTGDWTPDSRPLSGIQAIKGVEVGDGFALAAMRVQGGTRSCWSMARSPGPPGTVVAPKAGCRPASLARACRHETHQHGAAALRTVDVATGEAATAINQRSDACAVPAAAVIAEAMVALVLADALLEKTGGDSPGEVRRNLTAYQDSLR